MGSPDSTKAEVLDLLRFVLAWAGAIAIFMSYVVLTLLTYDMVSAKPGGSPTKAAMIVLGAGVANAAAAFKAFRR